MISLDAATVLLQWATGGMLFCWFTTRRRIASLGYGWLLRGVYFCFAAGSLAAGLSFGVVPVREAASVGVMIAVRVRARRVGSAQGRRCERSARRTRSSHRTGRGDDGHRADGRWPVRRRRTARRWSRVAPSSICARRSIGAIGLVAAAVDAGGNPWVALARTLVGAAFIGALSDAMLLGHWYLTQPGLPRVLLNEMVAALAWLGRRRCW